MKGERVRRVMIRMIREARRKRRSVHCSAMLVNIASNWFHSSNLKHVGQEEKNKKSNRAKKTKKEKKTKEKNEDGKTKETKANDPKSLVKKGKKADQLVIELCVTYFMSQTSASP